MRLAVPALLMLCLASYAAADSTDSTVTLPGTPGPVIPGTTAPAQAPAAPTTSMEVRIVRATSDISLDGVLSEAAWQSAPPITGFRQRDPNYDAEPTQRTEVRLLYDDDALYIGARMYDTSPDSIIMLLTRRDQQGARSDGFRVYLDPYLDRRSGYYFSVSAAGTLYDGTIYNDGWTDDSWDGVWNAKAEVDKDGWTAEMRIPFNQLRFTKAEVQTWGINLNRQMGRGFEDDYLVCQPKSESGFVHRFPTLVGLQGVSCGSAVEVVPYASSKAEYLHHLPFDPFNDGSKYYPNMGGDLRMAVGDKLTLNATVNPDFGQVEVDPAVVNLSDLEIRYPEKRPFFVQGSSIFDAGQQGASDYWNFNWPSMNFFYSRRIGRTLPGIPPGEEMFADVPQTATILGAAKLAGKLNPSINFGTLQAVTSKEDANVQHWDLTQADRAVEPLSYFGVTRLLKEFKDRQNGLGVIATTVARNFNDAELVNDFNKTGLAGAVDGWHYLDKNQVWVLSGWAGGTYIEGSEARIADVQTSSRHYYQRPDAESYHFDPTRTSLAGHGARVWLNKQKGNWFSNSAIGYLSPGFDIADAGFMGYGDNVNAHAGVGYKWTTPTKHVKNHNILGAVFGNSDFDKNITGAGAWGKAFWWYTNNWTLELQSSYSPQTVANRRSRGGPLMLNEPSYDGRIFFDTDGSRNRYYYLTMYAYNAPNENSYNYNIEGNFTWKPMSNLSLSLVPSFDRTADGAYYVTTLADPAATNTFGNRYIFAHLDQKTLAANFRINVAFTPTMSLQFYGQPLIFTREYTDYKELAKAKSLDFLVSGQSVWTYDPVSHVFDPDGAGPAVGFSRDFNAKSLIGNAVFRWEYMPGSAFYLVWTQNRDDAEPISEMSVGPSLHRLVDANADNVFLAKLTYYLNF